MFVIRERIYTHPVYLMFCEGTVVGSKLPEDGVNEHQKLRSRNWYVGEETV